MVKKKRNTAMISYTTVIVENAAVFNLNFKRNVVKLK